LAPGSWAFALFFFWGASRSGVGLLEGRAGVGPSRGRGLTLPHPGHWGASSAGPDPIFCATASPDCRFLHRTSFQQIDEGPRQMGVGARVHSRIRPGRRRIGRAIIQARRGADRSRPPGVPQTARWRAIYSPTSPQTRTRPILTSAAPLQASRRFPRGAFEWLRTTSRALEGRPVGANMDNSGGRCCKDCREHLGTGAAGNPALRGSTTRTRFDARGSRFRGPALRCARARRFYSRWFHARGTPVQLRARPWESQPHGAGGFTGGPWWGLRRRLYSRAALQTSPTVW